jgi:hypothetical protein
MELKLISIVLTLIALLQTSIAIDLDIDKTGECFNATLGTNQEPLEIY